jgi:succinyl-diaminopimelate desuccinylase
MPQLSASAVHLRELIACPSVTPHEGGALTYLGRVLADAGFTVTRKTFSAPGTPDVENLFATIGKGSPHLAFSGHTDVVPPGDEKKWSQPPFAAVVDDGIMFGRGAVDMKGGIACFLAAAVDYLGGDRRPGSLSLLITGDEEGPSINGTVKLLEWASGQGHRFDAAIVGEPTSQKQVGDSIKIGRRGGLSATITLIGRQGHAAYPHLADNPVPKLVRLLNRLIEMKLEGGSADFQPSNLEVTSIDVGNPAFNVIPGEASAKINVRFNDAWSAASLEEAIRHEIAAMGADSQHITLTIVRASDWFLTRPGDLTALLSEAVREATGLVPGLSTVGGTSDARFFRDVCPVVELGLVGQTMHQVDERVPLADLDRLTAIYRGFLERYFGR